MTAYAVPSISYTPEQQAILDAHPRSQPHWVYRMFDEDGSLLYIGMTRVPALRLRAWRSTAKQSAELHWFLSTDRMSWRLFPSFWDAARAERQAIRSERPLHNVIHNRGLAA